METMTRKVAIRDTHVVFDTRTMRQIEQIAKAEDRTIVSAVRVLIKEALQAREQKIVDQEISGAAV